MAKPASVLKLVGAWLLLPAALAALGYYVIGPNLGTEGAPKEGQASADSGDEESSPSYREPKVDVSVKKGSTVSSRDLQRPRRRKKPTPKPAEPKPPESAPTSESGETIPLDDGTNPG